jgi:hypothetical protein
VTPVAIASLYVKRFTTAMGTHFSLSSNKKEKVHATLASVPVFSEPLVINNVA